MCEARAGEPASRKRKPEGALMPQHKGSKKLIPVPEPIVRELLPLAKRSGMTIQEAVTLILSYAARTLRGRENIGSIFTEAALLSDARRFGGIVVPLPAIQKLLDGLDDKHLEDFIDSLKPFISSISISARVREYGVNSPRDVLALLLPLVDIDEISLEDGTSRLIVTAATPLGKNVMKVIESVTVEVLRQWGCRILNVETHETLLVIDHTCGREGE